MTAFSGTARKQSDVGSHPGIAWSGYAMAIALTVIAIWSRVTLTPLIGDQIPFATLFWPSP